LEISKGLRKKMFFDLETHRGRNMKRDVFHKFVSVLRKTLEENLV
jgi:phage replication-related protein YjqB (UPF0714/DUF867 family)